MPGQGACAAVGKTIAADAMALIPTLYLRYLTLSLNPFPSNLGEINR
ncbi:hypothetical protein [Halomicronema sp. CCY15110]|nr:hypothetical protein [Halomicronema sp. CCY15110]